MPRAAPVTRATFPDNDMMLASSATGMVDEALTARHVVTRLLGMMAGEVLEEVAGILSVPGEEVPVGRDQKLHASGHRQLGRFPRAQVPDDVPHRAKIIQPVDRRQEHVHLSSAQSL